MKLQLDIKGQWRQQLKESLLIGMVGGLIQGFIAQDSFLSGDNWKGDIFVFCWSAANWICLWKGNQLLVVIIDQYINWIDRPRKRIIVGLVAMLVYTIATSLILYLFFFGVIWGRDALSEIVGNMWAFTSIPVAITSTIMIISHGSSFLQSWRQSAVNLEKVKQEKLAVEYEALKNQVNPHFLFNSLNVLSSLVYDDQKKAVQFINELSKVYRYVLDSRGKDVVDIEEELAFVHSYVFLQKIRFGENLNFVEEVDGHGLKGSVPPMAIQLLIENAIKHNVISNKKPLSISLTVEGDAIRIENDLQEKLSKDSTGIGLQNLRDRYRYLSDKPMEVINKDDRFIVVLPLLKFQDEISNH